MDQRANEMAPKVGRKLTWLAAATLAATVGLVTTSVSAQPVGMRPDINAAKQGSKWFVHGLTMAQIAKRFGQPEHKVGPVPKVGTKLNPPITRWEYPDFTIYFEHNIALHLVKDHQRDD